MNYDKLISIAKEQNITAIELYSERSKGMNFRIFEGKLDKYTVSDTTSLAVRGIYNNKMGYVSVENLSDENIPFIIEKIKSNASTLTINEESFIYKGDDEYVSLEKPDTSFMNISTQEKISMMKAFEKEILSKDPRITNVSYLAYGERYIETVIKNSQGLNLTKEKAHASIVASCVAKEDGDVKTKYEVIAFSDFNKINLKEVADRLVDKVLSSLHASPVSSKKYPVILENEAAGELLRAFEPMFSGESVVRGTTILKDKLNEKIVSDKITLIDDPFFTESLEKEPFDDEGVASYTKEIISNGVLKTFLHNLKTANTLKVKTTGNGFKASVGSPVGTRVSNLILKNGDTSLKEMIESIDEGLLITSVQGLHAGVNTVTGDFNLQSSGYLIENKKIVRPVTLIVIGGNFIEMLNNVEYVGNDILFTADLTGCPSLKVNSLVVSGK